MKIKILCLPMVWCTAATLMAYHHRTGWAVTFTLASFLALYSMLGNAHLLREK